jgi:hypothetical protein
MVGRAEVITPQVETNLFQLVSAAHTGDTTARAKALQEFAHLGRFANPALQLAMSHTTDLELMGFGSQLLNIPSKFE